MLDQSDRNENKKYINIKRVCTFCGLTQESPKDSLEPVTWVTAQGMLYDPKNKTMYLLGDGTEDLPDDQSPIEIE
jgi:hypothetical protein